MTYITTDLAYALRALISVIEEPALGSLEDRIEAAREALADYEVEFGSLD